MEIEGARTHKLQSSPLFSTRENSSVPQYEPFNETNSEKLPAQFVLKLSQPFPMFNTSIQRIINEIHEPTTIKDALTAMTSKSKDSLINLIARQELDLNKGPFCRSLVDSLKINGDSRDLTRHVYSVKLLEQYHTYHILDNHLERQDGVYVTKIPFTHPASIPIILKILRQQALFNFVIGSCIRRNKNNNPSSSNHCTTVNLTTIHLTGTNNLLASNNASATTDENVTSEAMNDASIYDVIPVSLNSVCVSFEHPSKESLATLEIDFRDCSCRLYALDKESVCSNDYATRVFQKCWSIPITLRSVLRKCTERRLALLEDANRRRERELQELLTSNNSNPPQVSLQIKSQQSSTIPKTTILSSKFSSASEKSNPRDLNSIAEYLSSKLNNNASTANNSSTSSQASTTNASQDADNRSSLLKKFSCKPKLKQNNPAAKNQTGNNKILSLMLKRQNSTPSSSDDTSLKATITKKARTKTTPETNAKVPLTMTKLISPEVANAARLASQAAKQQGSKQQNPSSQPNVSLSLIRSPSKQTNQMVPQSSNNNTVAVGISLTPTPGLAISSNQNSSINVKLKTQINGTEGIAINNNNNNNSTNNVASKPRKSSIGAVIDRIVGGLAPGDQNPLANSQAATSIDSQQDSPRTSQVKSKSRAPGDQFAIKQGTSGGLKLTVTKTNTSRSPLTPSGSSTPSTSSSQPTANTSASLASTNSASASTSSNLGQSASSSTNNNASSEPPQSSKSTSSNSTIDSHKLLGGLLGTSIKYTIPKISKTSQASSDSNAASSGSDSNSQGDESTNPSSSANPTATPTSSSQGTSATAGTKRISATPFGRPNNSNRNPVSSSTHPLSRTTSNPLAGANNRPTSTSNNKDGGNDLNGTLNRISSSNQGPRQLQGSGRVGVQQQQKQQQPTGSRLLNSNLSQQPNQTPLFALGLNQPSSFANTTDINILAANQAALLNQQRSQQQQQQQQLQLQQTLKQPSNSMIPNLAPGQFMMTSSVDTSIISSSKLQFASGLVGPSQPMNPLQLAMNLAPSSSTIIPSTQATPSMMNAVPPQFYVPQTTAPLNPIVSSTPRNTMNVKEATSIPQQQQQQALGSIQLPQLQQQQPPLIPSIGGQPILSFQPTMSSTTQQTQQPLQPATGLGQTKKMTGGVSSSSDNGKAASALGDPASPGPDFSTPSSPTEATGIVNAVQPPPLIPIDSLEEPQATSPELPDDASDRLSIVDVNDNAADSLSAVGTPKPSSQVQSPMSVPQVTDSSNPAIIPTSSQSSLREPSSESAGAATAAPALAGGQSCQANESIENPMDTTSPSKATPQSEIPSSQLDSVPSAHSVQQSREPQQISVGPESPAGSSISHGAAPSNVTESIPAVPLASVEQIGSVSTSNVVSPGQASEAIASTSTNGGEQPHQAHQEESVPQQDVEMAELPSDLSSTGTAPIGNSTNSDGQEQTVAPQSFASSSSPSATATTNDMV